MDLKVLKVEPLKPLMLKITFSSNEVKYFDMAPYCNSDFFSELKNWNYFKLVKPSNRTVEWPHEQDIATETLFLEGKDRI